MAIVKVIEVIASSEKSIEDAIQKQYQKLLKVLETLTLFMLRTLKLM